MAGTLPLSTAIRVPTQDLSNHTTVLRQLKEAVESGQRLRGDPNTSFARVGELILAGLVRLDNGKVLPANTELAPVQLLPNGIIRIQSDGILLFDFYPDGSIYIYKGGGFGTAGQSLKSAGAGAACHWG